MGLVTIVHKVCGEPAFFYDGFPAAADPPDHRKARLLDGSKPVASDVIRCGSCGTHINWIGDLNPQ